ncbi:hypothetical protein [Thermoflexus sp.]|uniref:hypothetical protein n=1 Tax=Thermoflexus sp. TaxID=1969742 RepID=UPI0035E409AA
MGCSPFVDRDQTAVVPEAAIVLEPGHTVGQTFVARHGGLNGVEFWLEPAPGSAGRLRLRLRADPQSTLDLAEAVLSLDQVAAPGFYRFSFAPDHRSPSAYRYAFLELEGIGAVRVGAAPGGAYLDGAAYRDHEPLDAQLAFRLTYDPWGMALELGRAMLEGLGLLAVAALLYLVPGYAVLAYLLEAPGGGGGDLPWPARMGLAAGLSLALYPLLFLWADLVGLHLGPLYAWGPITLGLAALAWRHRRWRPPKGWEALQGWARSHAFWPDLAFVFIIAMAFGVRLLAVRTLEAPMWGDGLQHTVIVQLLLDHGGLFRSWEPYAPIQSFTYHFGFHSAVALLAWALGWSAVQAVLVGGQILNALAVLTLYPLARRLARGSAWAGVVAVLMPALLWPMPMFYVNWGRYPQLAGQAILPVAVALTWDLLERPTWSWREAFLVAGAAAGLALTHYRVLVFYGAFLGAWGLVRLWRAWKRENPFGAFRWLAIGAFSLGLIAPWLLRVREGRLGVSLVQASTTGWGEVTLPSWEDLRFYMPQWGWVLGILALGAGWIQRRRETGLLIAWWGGVFFLAHPHLLRLPGAWVIHSFAFWIAFYLPMALLIAIGTEGLGVSNALRKRGWQGLILVGVLGLWGGRDRAREVDPYRYALLTRPDQRAMAWIREHLETDARFLINGFPAYAGEDVVGSDGGWWLPVLARRPAWIPPLPYAIERTDDPQLPAQLREGVARLARRDPQIVWQLAARGWCYVYIGQRRGSVNAPIPPLWRPDEMEEGLWEAVYHRDLVWIFKFSGCDPSRRGD